MVELPVIIPDIVGVFTIDTGVKKKLELQAFPYVTITFPPDEPANKLIIAVVEPL